MIRAADAGFIDRADARLKLVAFGPLEDIIKRYERAAGGV
jgi:hypothetical protein